MITFSKMILDQIGFIQSPTGERASERSRMNAFSDNDYTRSGSESGVRLHRWRGSTLNKMGMAVLLVLIITSPAYIKVRKDDPFVLARPVRRVAYPKV